MAAVPERESLSDLSRRYSNQFGPGQYDGLKRYKSTCSLQAMLQNLDRRESIVAEARESIQSIARRPSNTMANIAPSVKGKEPGFSKTEKFVGLGAHDREKANMDMSRVSLMLGKSTSRFSTCSRLSNAGQRLSNTSLLRQSHSQAHNKINPCKLRSFVEMGGSTTCFQEEREKERESKLTRDSQYSNQSYQRDSKYSCAGGINRDSKYSNVSKFSNVSSVVPEIRCSQKSSFDNFLEELKSVAESESEETIAELARMAEEQYGVGQWKIKKILNAKTKTENPKRMNSKSKEGMFGWGICGL